MGNVNRRDDWPERLDDALKARANTPFEYGVHDCVMFGVYLIAAQTYASPRELLPGYAPWTNEAEARAALGSRGVLGCARAAARAVGLRACKLPFAQRGFPVVVVNDTEPVFGVISLDGSGAIVAATVGWTILPRSRVIAAWSL